MKNLFKHLTFIYLLLTFVFLPLVCVAATSPDLSTYKLIAPLPGLVGESVNIKDGLGNYLNKLYTAGVAIATGLAVLMIVIGGIQYVSSDAIGGKSDGIKRIQDALIGLLLAFMSYLLLNTINPDLVNNDLQLEDAPLNGASLSGNKLPTGGVINNNQQAAFQNSEMNKLTEELNNPNTTEDRKKEIVKRIEALSSGFGGSDAGVLIASFKNQQRSTTGGLNISTYGSSHDSTPDTLTSAGFGNNNNKLVPGSVALSPDLISKYKPAPGASVYINGKLIGYYDDTTDNNTKEDKSGIPIVNTVDVYDPQGIYGSGVLKGTSDINWQINFGTPRAQIPNR